jgi:hypothetical protein
MGRPARRREPNWRPAASRSGLRARGDAGQVSDRPVLTRGRGQALSVRTRRFGSSSISADTRQSIASAKIASWRATLAKLPPASGRGPDTARPDRSAWSTTRLQVGRPDWGPAPLILVIRAYSHRSVRIRAGLIRQALRVRSSQLRPMLEQESCHPLCSGGVSRTHWPLLRQRMASQPPRMFGAQGWSHDPHWHTLSRHP